jgi:BASS family bile acid:Na+ symporter
MFENYHEYEYLLARVQLVFFMLGMGATLEISDFARIMRRPTTLLYGLGYLFVIMPLLAVLVSRSVGVEPGIGVGLILISLMPGGVVSKVFSFLGRGNVALSITLTAFGSFACVITVPLFLRLLASDYVPADFSVPLDLVLPDVSLYLLLPLTMGMVWGHFSPANRMKFSHAFVGIGWFFVLLMVIGSIASGRIHPGDYGWRTPLAIIVFCLLSQQLSMLPFYYFRWPRADRLAVGIEMTMRNMNLALLLMTLLFPQDSDMKDIADGTLFVILFYAAVALGIGLLLALNHVRLARKEKRNRREKEE